MNLTRFPLARWCAGLGLTLGLIGAGVAQAAETTRVIVSFKPGVQAAQAARAAIAGAGGTVKLELIGGEGVAVELPNAAIAALKKHPAVALVEEDARRYPMSLTEPSGPPYRKGQLLPYGIPMVQADKLPNLDDNAGNRTICIIDSGYDNTHIDLPHNRVTGDDDLGGAGPWDHDGLGHGTHVAGTIAAVNQRDVGVIGVLPSKKIHLHIVRVFNDAGDWAYSSTLANAAKKCQAAGANVISMSLGGSLPNATERKTFDNLRDAGILSVAAAGNGGNTLTSYPAGYGSVVSVAALDENKAWATFSQRNSDVELAAPGVLVLSTVPMGTGSLATLSVGGTAYSPIGMDGSPNATVSAPLADFGLGEVIDPNMAGKVCLTQRGNITFALKVQNCEASGGVGSVIYNNVPGSFAGTLGGVSTGIPSVSASDTEGTSMLAQLGQAADLSVEASHYAFFDGTSMATPHVSAVAALVWSYFPTCTSEQLRASLDKSAQDLGAAGRDVKFGYGLVRAKAAYDRILAKGCGN
ncbi:S8 family serine peptidase [Ideonella sp.]|uniref:S8 family serine peptidase n=1 Tax=Ideonella sp. TaxID=1929293 RepID=UPI002B499C03|nr:S8 family serine peptidase [Ideonella sp.]HJV71418.1 S8 family serine peptidase [Ideonella sp.]